MIMTNKTSHKQHKHVIKASYEQRIMSGKNTDILSY